MADHQRGANNSRFSGLPQPVLHHILSFLSQKESIQTCLLSKSWRHVGSTRPKIEFLQESFNNNGDNKQAFLSAIDSTLQRYLRQNLPLHQFILRMWALDPDSISLLHNWIPILTLSMGVKKFHLSFHSDQSDYFDFPWVVFQSHTLENLHLEKCALKTEFSSLTRLRTLRLDRACISGETFEKILSSCPLIECLSLYGCTGLETINVRTPCNLKHFAFNDFYEVAKEVDEHLSIEIDSPSVRTIRITGCPNWNREFSYFPKLESLFLNRVKLPTNLFGFFSSYYLPCLERLTLDSCSGFQRCNLDLGGSVKYLIIRNLENKVIEAEIIVPNIVEFVYEGEIPEMPISFNTHSPDWKSSVTLSSYSDFDKDAGSWLNKLSGLLESLKESKISVTLFQHRRMNQPNNNIQDVPSSLLLSNVDYRCFFQPVEVEQLSLRGYFSSSSFPAFLNCLFCVCRPRYIGQHSYSYSTTDWEKEDKELNESLLEFLILEKNMRRCFWPEGLEDVRMIEASIENEKDHVVAHYGLKWRPFR